MKPTTERKQPNPRDNQLTRAHQMRAEAKSLEKVLGLGMYDDFPLLVLPLAAIIVKYPGFHPVVPCLVEVDDLLKKDYSCTCCWSQ